MRTIILFLLITFAFPAFASTVLLEEMTWQEVRDAIKAGKTTVIVPTGGTEQNGPHIVLGKHNFILRRTSVEIATKLGNALVAPIMPYVPEGDFNPPTGHMRFAGTMSLTPATFASFLEDTARSLKTHGFKNICFVGEHGASQKVQAEVAEKLSNEWKNEGVIVLHVGNYYDYHNGQVEWAKKQMEKEEIVEAHGGLADTSEMLYTYPTGVRNDLRGNYKPDDMDKLGTNGASDTATVKYGEKFIELKVDAAVKQIEKERLSTH